MISEHHYQATLLRSSALRLGCWRLVLIVLLASGLISGVVAATMFDQGAAMLRVLDKVTGRVTTLEVGIGQTEVLLNLQLTVRACREPSSFEPPESVAFLEARDLRSGRGQPIFRGWMFASSPGLSSLEHPIYDVWVIDCLEAAPDDVFEP